MLLHPNTFVIVFQKVRNGIFSSFFYSFVRCDVVFFLVGLEEFFLCFNDCKLVLMHIFPLFGGAEPRTVLHWIALVFASGYLGL